MTEYRLDPVRSQSALQCSSVPRHFLLGGGGRFDQLTNYCYLKKVTENTVANSFAAWLTFDQLSGKLKFFLDGGGASLIAAAVF